MPDDLADVSARFGERDRAELANDDTVLHHHVLDEVAVLGANAVDAFAGLLVAVELLARVAEQVERDRLRCSRSRQFDLLRPLLQRTGHGACLLRRRFCHISDRFHFIGGLAVDGDDTRREQTFWGHFCLNLEGGFSGEALWLEAVPLQLVGRKMNLSCVGHDEAERFEPTCVLEDTGCDDGCACDICHLDSPNSEELGCTMQPLVLIL